MFLEDQVANIPDNKFTLERCPICKEKFRAYKPYGEKLRRGARCPKCNSCERHREIALYIKKEYKNFQYKKNIRVLHVAPEGSLVKIFKNKKNIDYYPVDINPEFKGIRETADITNLKYDDNFFDVIMCNHVLEHIEDDKKAMKEIRRVLKEDGVAFLNVPLFNIPQTIENPEYNTPELRFKYYRQRDHVRCYGKDYVQRLEQAGFKIKVICVSEHFTKKQIEKYHLTKTEELFECKKQIDYSTKINRG